MSSEALQDIISQDDFGLLNTQEKPTIAAMSEDDRLVASFQEINAFISEHGREPKSGSGVHEHQLHMRLEAIRDDAKKAIALVQYDKHNLLTAREVYQSLDEIYASDSFGLLAEETDSIFNLKHVPSGKETNMPDYVAQRKPCPDFVRFEHLFKQCHRDMVKGQRTTLKFKQEQQIEQGQFFILKRVLLYIADVGERHTVNGQTNARLRIIFENGTESDMLLRSLAAELYKDGKRVTEHAENMLDGFSDGEQQGISTGYVYVARSLGTHPEIVKRKHLFKIGFTRNTPEQRLQNAQNDPTFLNAPAEIVQSYECQDLNAQKVENLMHTVFGSACLNIDIDGYQPREWFVVPFPVIDDAIELLVNGNIVNYTYDAEKQELVLR